MSDSNIPEVPKAGVVYGDIIYWITVISAFVAIIGSMMVFMTDANYVSATHMLTGIWEGKSIDEIWGSSRIGAIPEEHWYLSNLSTGDGLSSFALSLGVFSVIPAIFAAAYMMLKDGQKLFGGMAVVAGLITTLAMIGVISV